MPLNKAHTWIMKKYTWLIVLAAVLLLVGAGVSMAMTSYMHTSSSNTNGLMMNGSNYSYSRLSCSAPSNLPGSTVNVTAVDMGMNRMMGGTAPRGVHMMLRANPTTVPAGQVSLVASNMGWRTHELVILALASGASAGQRVPGSDGKVDEVGSLAEASASCGNGKGDGIKAGTVGWTTVSLKPGRYEILCNLQNHYADGMWQELDVSS
jgi:uncharacterized cupredoxin-like copper-binding protein